MRAFPAILNVLLTCQTAWSIEEAGELNALVDKKRCPKPAVIYKELKHKDQCGGYGISKCN